MCRYLVWQDKAQSYFEKYQFKIVVVFPHIFVADTKLIYGYNFLALYIVTSFHEQLLEKDNSVSIHRKI